jgi:hypothetical protein
VRTRKLTDFAVSSKPEFRQSAVLPFAERKGVLSRSERRQSPQGTSDSAELSFLAASPSITSDQPLKIISIPINSPMTHNPDIGQFEIE